MSYLSRLLCALPALLADPALRRAVTVVVRRVSEVVRRCW